MEERNNILPDHKRKGPLNSKLLQNRMTNMSSKRKPLQVPRNVHGVGELVDCFVFVGCITKKDPEICGGGNDGEMFASQGRNKLYHAMDRMQHITTYMFAFDKDQRQCCEDVRYVGIVWTSNLETKRCASFYSSCT
jgi:hypothetical protein